MGRRDGKADPSVDKKVVKALVALYGPREAARQAGLPAGTVTGWACKYQWKRAKIKSLPRATSNISNKDAGDALKESLENSRINSTLNLAKYTEKASEMAAKSKNPLEMARKVRDVAGVYSILFPPEEGDQLIEGSILIGAAKVTDNLQEIEASLVESDVIDVREELSDRGPEGD